VRHNDDLHTGKHLLVHGAACQAGGSEGRRSTLPLPQLHGAGERGTQTVRVIAKKEVVLFLKKKKAGPPPKKDFCYSGPRAFKTPGSGVTEFFAPAAGRVVLFLKGGFFPD
jgi:hypothetical protein